MQVLQLTADTRREEDFLEVFFDEKCSRGLGYEEGAK